MDIEQHIEKKAHAVRYSVKDAGKEVGRARLYIMYNDLHEEPFGLMEDVFVEKTHRGKGIGTTLVQAVIEGAKEYGCYKLLAQSRYGKEKVHKLYEGFGFTDHGKNFRMNF